MKSITLLLILFFSFFITIAQELQGVVLNQKSNAPIIGASVYFDNTSIGTTTNFDGEFYIVLKQPINSPLVVSFVGFETAIYEIQNFETDKIYKLKEDVNILAEVVLDSKDEWSREFKLKQFRREFLGQSEFAEKCTILNEDLLVLNFEREAKQLVVSAKAPIIVKNNALDYIVKYDINDFYISYNMDIEANLDLEKVFRTVASVGYSGTTFFENIESKKHKRALKNRQKAYTGSALHFMRAIVNNRLRKEKFKIFIGRNQAEPSLHIKTFKNDSLNVTGVELSQKLNILCKGRQSAIKSEVKRFYIDAYGNHAPIDKVLFGGFMAKQRIGDVLPLDYGL
ncbi:carboxypeptidase-like regulatory domain-containing protein [Lacinutrix jangbogonensis]|uniref:carboxypeptidase-like regulatory domain-containing protein n=1 Tax=Lacinutrix jangbogonensis TaxID=1469557 RepID=UPI00053EE8B4|nr:carboxypeptidase-like regulatory domain-containing protein [Lacinutrix jangbogonensis]